MLTNDALKYYKTRRSLAEALGVTVQAIYQWAEMVPMSSAVRLQKLSGGALKFDADSYSNYRGWRKSRSAKDSGVETQPLPKGRS